MTERRIKALRELATRGATQGERDAAQRALDVHLGKQAAANPPPASAQSRTFQGGASGQDFADLLARMKRNAEAQQRYVWSVPYVPYSTPSPSFSRNDNARPYWQQQGYGFTVTVDAAPRPKPAQPRGAVPSDFPEAELAVGNTEDEFVRVEVMSASEMHRRFHLYTPFKISWSGRVWEVSEVSGYSHDRTQQRFYLHVRKDAIKIVTVGG